jgi:hypothetical protein
MVFSAKGWWVIVGYLGTGYPKVNPSPCFDPLADQLPTERACEAERPTNSPPSNYTRRNDRPTPSGETLQGRVDDQLPVEQPCEVGRPTNSESANRARQRTWLDDVDPRRLRQDATSPTHVRTYV